MTDHFALPPPARRSVLPTVIAIAVILAMIAGGAVGVAAWLKHRRTVAVQRDISAAYAPVRDRVDRARAAAADALAGPFGSPALRFTGARCAVDSVDAGWIVQSYEVFCILQTVDAYPVSAGYDPLARQLVRAGTGLGADVLGQRAVTAPKRGCGVVRSWIEREPRTSSSVVVTRLAAGSFDPARPSDGVDTCGPPDLGLFLTAGGSSWVSVQDRYDPAALGADRSWLVVSREETYVNRDVGCTKVIFCSFPLGDLRPS